METLSSNGCDRKKQTVFDSRVEMYKSVTVDDAVIIVYRPGCVY